MDMGWLECAPRIALRREKPDGRQANVQAAAALLPSRVGLGRQARR
jgi:hypothetical protein